MNDIRRHRGDLFEFAAATDRGGGSVAEWLACWTQAQKGAVLQVQIAAATLSGNSLSSKLFTPVVPQLTKQQNW